MLEDQERYLKVGEVAQRLNITRHTIRRWLRAGKLRGVKMGGARLGWRILESEIQRIMDGGATK